VTVAVQDVLDAAGAAGAADTAVATTLLAEAELHVDGYITRTLLDADNPVPDEIRDAAVLTCATDLFARYKAPFGQQVSLGPNGQPISIRLGADPLGGVRPRLRPYCFEIGFGFPDVDYTVL
jgi:hypothetical protein